MRHRVALGVQLSTGPVPTGLMQGQPMAAFPVRCWVARRGVPGPSQAQAGCPDERVSHPRPCVATQLRVRALPLGCQARSHSLHRSFSFLAWQAVHREDKRSELATPSQARLEIPVLLPLFVARQDFRRILTSMRRRVGVDDAHIKDGCGPALPEATDCHVSSRLRWEDFRVCWRCCCLLPVVLTRVDEWFVRHSGRGERSGAELVPFSCHFVVAEKDQASLLARQGMLDGEFAIAAVATRREVGWFKPVANSQGVSKLFG